MAAQLANEHGDSREDLMHKSCYTVAAMKYNNAASISH